MSVDLNDFESNPDDFDINEDNVEALLNQVSDDSEESESNIEERVDPVEETETKPSEDKPKEEEEKPSEDDKPEPSEAQEKVVVTRDGKHQIPYSVLEQERKRNVELQRELEAARALQAKPAEPQEAKQDQPGQSSDKDKEDLERIREEFGDEAAEAERARREHYAHLMTEQAELKKELEEQKAWRRQQETKTQDVVMSEINEAIDSIPQLQQWRDSGDPMWAAAVALDEGLKTDPANQDLSYKERFELVVEKLTGTKPNPKTDEIDTEKVLQEKLAKSESDARIPSSLSDIPGGQAPAQSEQDSLEQLSTTQLEAKFESMTEAQREEYLARL